jgi:hypothetical protein
MRLLRDTLVALMLTAILAGVVWHHRHEGSNERAVEETFVAVRTIQRQVLLQSQLGKVEVDQRGYPTTIDPEWFDERPVNALVGSRHPWIEIAPRWQHELSHPPDRAAAGRMHAQFWYNPNKGIVRARVPVDIAESRALRYYNRINQSDLSALFEDRELVTATR